MKAFFYIFKITLYTLFFLGIFNSAFSKVTEYNFNAKNISNYFSGLVSFDDFDYETSQKFFKKLPDQDNEKKFYSSKYIQSLINLEKYTEAYNYSRNLEKKSLSNFESNLFIGLYEFKKENYQKALLYFNKLEPNFEHELIFEILKVTLNTWTKLSLSKNKEDIKIIDQVNPIYANLSEIQKTFANCYLKTTNTKKYFDKLINSEISNFSRYNFFYANYLYNNDEKDEAEIIINAAYRNYPGNLIIRELKNSFDEEEKNKNKFNCQSSNDILAEVLYVLANALSTQKDYKLSNFYISLSKFLNPNFLSFDSLLAENLYVLKKNNQAKKIYKKLSKIGSVYKWYSSKQIARIMESEKDANFINYLSNSYKKINKPNVYDTFDLANFFRNNENYQKSIKLYSEILKKISKNHKLYPEVLERRGMSYERIDNWELAEKDLLMSLEILPNQPYAMNYLAYTWVEKNKNIDEALKMLKNANELLKNNGYITDSLGWALFKLKNFSEAKKYLEFAIMLMPQDPVINDHFADCLWMNNYKIQARYFWNNVLKLDNVEEDLKKKVEQKLLFGLNNS